MVVAVAAGVGVLVFSMVIDSLEGERFWHPIKVEDRG